MLSASKMISIFAKILTKAQKNISHPQRVKYLGVMIESTLSWHTHIENIFKKCQEGCVCYIKLKLN